MTTTLLRHRYDSPTAQLEITGRPLALSQWSDLPVVQVHHFRLWLWSGDSADHPPATAVEIAGDRAQFLALQTALHTYVEQTLGAVPGGIPDSREPDVPDSPHLTPQGLTGHRLHLGSLRTPTGDDTIRLGAVQLADLTQVFAQLDQQVRVVPVDLRLQGSARRWQRWSSLAAGFVAVVGLAALWPSLNPMPPVTQSDQAATEGAGAAPEALPEADLAAPTPPTPVTTPETAAPETAAPAPSPEATPGEPAPPTATPKATDRPSTQRDRDRPRAPQAPTDGTGDRPRAPTASDGVIATAPPEETSELAPEGDVPQPFTAVPGAEQRAAPSTASSAATLSPFDALAQSLAAQWEPPADLQTVLRYRLRLGEDGTVEAVIPSDRATADYPTPEVLPPVGAAVVPPNTAPALRVTLYPDGSVTVIPLTAAD